MDTRNSFWVISLALLAAACAGPGPKSAREAMAEQRQAEQPSGFEVHVVGCQDALGRAVRPYPEDPRLGYDPGCVERPVFFQERRSRHPEPRRLAPKLPPPRNIGLFPR